ncbi:MAG: ferritin family protein [Spirochaetales bacterium]|nr:ferritin family protein [Spirochaetales bacterium]
MDIFNYALQFEQDGEVFYRESAEKLTDSSLKKILLFLSKEEQKHFQMIKNLKDSSLERPKSIFISDVQNVFTQMKSGGVTFSDDKSTVVDILETGLVAEQDSINYYESKKNEIDDEKAKTLLGILRKQEDAHYSLLSSILEYYERPDLWLENAEFNHIDDY